MNQISNAEKIIMDVLWRNSPLTSKQIMTALEQTSDWHENTVRTLLSRLTQKGLLTKEKVKREYFYTPNLSQEKYIKDESKSFLSRLFNGEISPLIASFAEQDMLSDKDIDEIQTILEALKKEQKNE
ncbi:BlaI/MecI/CopY family transcriptional regulator [Alteromonadaceae bacterium M269]|nr:BlaI/MecI/CopY family transcriptional regulator [Alteromonadaceae bacterium M269]